MHYKCLVTWVCRNVTQHVWQSRVETEHYSIAYFDRIAVFEVL